MEGALETIKGIRRYRTDEEKRRMVEGTLASGESVAVMARLYGVNANQLFHWRKQYQAGLLGVAKRDGTKSDVQLLPVTVSDDHRPVESDHKLSSLERPTCTINIEFPGRALVSVEGQVDPALVRAVLESLRG
jgi:transposase